MTIIRRVRKEATFPFGVFLSGIIVGGIIVIVFFGSPEDFSKTSANVGSLLESNSSSSSSNINRQREVQETQSKEGNNIRGKKADDKQNDDGWHQINVFYGEKSGLGANPETKYFAQVHQDEAVLDLLGNTGYFIDLAANDALELTNTLALENAGWDGLCIEPNSVYWYGLSHRKCTVVGALVGGDTMEQVDVKFRGVYGGIVGKMDDKMANRKREPKSKTEKRYTAPFNEILKRFNVPAEIDYMSLDVEGAEYLIMQHFPFDRYQIKIITIERPNQQLKDLLEANGYLFLKELAWWGETLWAHKSTGFTPQHPKIVKIPVDSK